MKGLKHGVGKYYYNNKKNSLFYTGSWQYDAVQGEGTLFSIEGLLIFHGEFMAGRMIQTDSNALVMNMNRVFSVIHEEELEDEEREKSIMGMRRND